MLTLKAFLKNRNRVLLVYAGLIALAFIAMQLLRNYPAWTSSLFFLIMTATLPIGPIIDLIFFKISDDFPRQRLLFSILLPTLVTVGAYLQWRVLIPWTLDRLARVRRERSRK